MVGIEPPFSKPTSSRPVEVNGCAGREAVFEGPAQSAVFRIVIAGDKAFVLVAVGTGLTADTPRVRRIFDSFEITDAVLIQQVAERKAARQKADEQHRALAARHAEEMRRYAEKKQAETKEFEAGPYTGPPVPDPTGMRGLVLYLPFDGPDPTLDRVSGKSVV